MSIEKRLSDLERALPACPACATAPPTRVVYLDDGQPEPVNVACERCGRGPMLIIVQYVDTTDRRADAAGGINHLN